MLDGKPPIHEVVTKKLRLAAARILTEVSPNEDELVLHLDTLLQSGMKAAHAHHVAEMLAYLPESLKPLNNKLLVEYVEDVLANLRARKDETRLAEVLNSLEA